jgi:hypothetical protein
VILYFSVQSLQWVASRYLLTYEPDLGSSADRKGEEGIDRSFEWAGTPMYLGE